MACPSPRSSRSATAAGSRLGEARNGWHESAALSACAPHPTEREHWSSSKRAGREPVSARPVAALIDRASDVVGAPSIAVVADRRLSVAALVALLLGEPAVAHIREVEGTVNVISALLSFRPGAVVLERCAGRWQSRIDPAAWGGRLLLLDDRQPGDPALAMAGLRADRYLSRSASQDAL